MISFLYVDDHPQVHEEFVGLYRCENIAANTIVNVLKDSLLRFNLPLSRCCGQCYDGGSNVAGLKNEVNEQILRDEPRALFTHCYGHCLCLSVAYTVKTIKYLGSTMDLCINLRSKLLQYTLPSAQLFLRSLKQKSPLILLDFIFSIPLDGLCAMKPSTVS